MATASNARDPFVGKPKSGEGGGWEIPSEDVHDARIVALIDLGSHEESFQGGPPKLQRKVYLAFELDEKMSASSFNHVVGKEYTLSFHEKASLLKLTEAVLDDGAALTADGHLNYKALVGQPCTVQIKHSTSPDKTRTYANVGQVSAVSRKARDRVFRPGRKPFVWFLHQDLAELPDWLPRIFGEAIPEKIKRCRERVGAPDGTDEAALDDNTPF